MRASILLAAALLLTAPGVRAAPSRVDSLYAAWRPFLAAARASGPCRGPQDLYKLVHQGTMGPAHAVPEDESVLSWLVAEWRAMAADTALGGAAAAPFDPLRPDSQLVRVHLAPLAARVLLGVPVAHREQVLAVTWERLAHAFARTARLWRPQLGELRAVWSRAAADTALWGQDGTAAAAGLAREMERAGWPAVHHSDECARAARPHYRVAARALLPPAWLAAAGWPAPPFAGRDASPAGEKSAGRRGAVR